MDGFLRTNVKIKVVVVRMQDGQVGALSRIEYNLVWLANGCGGGVKFEACTVGASVCGGEIGGVKAQGQRTGDILRTGSVGLESGAGLVTVVKPYHRSTGGCGTVIDEEGVALMYVDGNNLQGDASLVGSGVDGERLVEVGTVDAAGPAIVIHIVVAALYRSLRTHVDGSLG